MPLLPFPSRIYSPRQTTLPGVRSHVEAGEAERVAQRRRSDLHRGLRLGMTVIYCRRKEFELFGYESEFVVYLIARSQKIFYSVFDYF